MPQDYAVLDNGQSANSKKPRSAKVKYVRSYLKSKGVKPTKDAASRSTRERKLRAKARDEFAKKSKSKTSTGSSSSKTTSTVRTGGAKPSPYGKYSSKAASGDSWRRGQTKRPGGM